MKMKLGTKLVMGGVLIVLVPLLTVGLIFMSKSSSALKATQVEQVVNLRGTLINYVDVVIAQEKMVMENFSKTPLVRQSASSIEQGVVQMAQFLIEKESTIFSDTSHYETFLMTDTAGVVIADASKGAYKGLDVSAEDYFKQAIEGKTVIGSVVKAKDTGEPVGVLASPLMTEEGKLMGTMISRFKLAKLNEKVSAVTIGSTGYPYLLNKEGIVIVHPEKEMLLSSLASRSKGMEGILGKMLTLSVGMESYVDEKGEKRLVAFAPVESAGWIMAFTIAESEYMAPVNAMRNLILLVGGIFVALSILSVIQFTRGITKPIHIVIGELKAEADQVASASEQLSSTSRSLAEGASEQAASIEETSSSLEEMSTMTRQNSDHAEEANSLMNEANQVIARANQSMGNLTTSMQEIHDASEEISKIIKAIDEIAFQTNLLALNAAVEAARAGVAGAGFAVVADEVRNLAMRAAAASRDTATLIEGTVKKIKHETEIVSETNQSFSEVAQSVSKVGQLVTEINAASSEQAMGIEQINRAVSEMDKVTQRTAASAEQSAAASQEMKQQAEQMKVNVDSLIRIVGLDSRSGPEETKFVHREKRIPYSPGREESSRRVPPKKFLT
jgi:methyl-accepting chemotaxis protein